MKFFIALVFASATGWLLIGCSDSTTPTTNYPLTLTIDSANLASGTFAMAFSLKVTKSDTSIYGATLVQSDELNIYPFYNVFNQGVSNSAGIFPEFFVFYDTATEVAFQAYKDTVLNNVKDTLWSNTILYTMP
jgi:hypothetical protein